MRTLSPAPVVAVAFNDGSNVKTSFQQPVNKAWAVDRATNLAAMIRAGELFRATKAGKVGHMTDAYFRADVAFRQKAVAKLKVASATISHPTVGIIDAATANDDRKRKVSQLDTFKAKLRDLINSGSDPSAIVAQMSDLVAA